MKHFIFLLFIIYSLLNATSALAAKLELVSSISEIVVGQEFQIDLMLDAENEKINAVEGKTVFPVNLLELKAIYIGNSIINFWIEQPAQKNGEINFSGVIPGGFSGILSPYYKGSKPGKVLSLVLKTKKEGYGNIEIKDARVLLNDGQGTSAELKISNFQFLISKQAPSVQAPIIPIKDADPPELFTPEIARDPNIFDSKWFLAFTAQDKNSGVDHYEIAEKRGSLVGDYAGLSWQTAESPYLLKDQALKSYIYVKAVDKAGNARIVYLAPKIKWYQKSPVYISLLVGVIILIRWLRRMLYAKKH